MNMKGLLNPLAFGGLGASAFVCPTLTSSSRQGASLGANPRDKAMALNGMALNGTDIRSIEAHELLGPWTQKHDWLLADIVPQYTVENEKNIVTSWGQIRSKSPFRDFSEDELKDRYNALGKCSGENPPVIQDWWVEGGNVMRGTVDGRSVWFTAQKGGSFDETASPEQGIFSTNGFVEATDDSIYELGVSAVREKKPEEPVPAFLEELGAATTRRTGYAKLLPLRETKREEPVLTPVEAALGAAAKESRRMVLIAILASSILSGGLAFNVGQQMGAYSQMLANHAARTSAVTTIVVRPCPHVSMDANQPQSAEIDMLSISEQRARQELRVIREKKAEAIIGERLKVDEQRLSELRNEEMRMEGIY